VSNDYNVSYIQTGAAINFIMCLDDNASVQNYVVSIPVVIWQAEEQKEKGGRSLLGWIYRRKHLLGLRRNSL
jgi:hypothetical protein